MKKFSFLVVVLSLAVTWSCSRIDNELSLTDESSLVNAKDGDIIPGQYIVRLKDGATSLRSAKLGYSDGQISMRNEVQKILEASAISPREPLFVYCASIEGFAVKLADNEVKSLKKNEAVLSISPDRVIALGKPGSQPSSYPSPQVVPWGVLRVHGIAQYSGTNKVWIIDTGIDLDHPDLNVSQDLGASFVTANTDDTYGHGTACAGVIAARNDNYGVVGVAPGALVIPVKVLDNNGNGTVSATLAGVDYVSNHAVPNDVVNMCIGTSVEPALDDAVTALADKGVFIAVPAGNGSVDADNVSPARADHPNIFTVSSVRDGDYCTGTGDPLSTFSNYGSHIDWAGPGEYIPTTYKNNALARYSGTSMAAAHIAGILLVTEGHPKTDGWIKDDRDPYPSEAIAVTGKVYWKFNPVVSTDDISAITSTSATTGATLISDGGLPTKEVGVCWSTQEEPEITDNKAVQLLWIPGLMTGLQANTNYYVRAFAYNLTDTAYGEQKSFMTTSEDKPIDFNPGLTYGLVLDVDGNQYKTINIGTKIWMAENLRTTTYNDGSVIPLVEENTEWAGLAGPGYCWFNNNKNKYGNLYGALYNWYAVSPTYNNNKNICPTGWHVPSKDEFSALISSLGGESVAGGKLKEGGTDHWVSPNTGATNSTGFTLMPGGRRTPDLRCDRTDENGVFEYLHMTGGFWTTTPHKRWADASYLFSGRFNGAEFSFSGNERRDGYSVRCVMD